MVKVGNLCFKDIDGYCGYTDIESEEEFLKMQYTGAHIFEIYAIGKEFSWYPESWEDYKAGIKELNNWRFIYAK